MGGGGGWTCCSLPWARESKLKLSVSHHSSTMPLSCFLLWWFTLWSPVTLFSRNCLSKQEKSSYDSMCFEDILCRTHSQLHSSSGLVNFTSSVPLSLIDNFSVHILNPAVSIIYEAQWYIWQVILITLFLVASIYGFFPYSLS